MTYSPSVASPVVSSTAELPPLYRSSAIAAPRVRDGRLDFWRALCLIDMVLVHLIYDGVNFGQGFMQKLIGEYTRFAAGGFVFVAGLSIGAIFLPRAMGKSGPRKVYFSLLRRALFILMVHFASALSFVSLDFIRGTRTEMPDLLPLLRDILLFREGGDLLPLYVIVLAAAPLMLELLRRRLWWLLALGSGLLFAWGQNHVWAFSSPLHQGFPVVLWQMMFAGGMLFGAALPSFGALSRRTRITLAVVATLLAILLWAGDYRSDFGWAWPNLPLVFCKTPLSFGEALRYFSLIFTIIFWTDLVWDRIAGSRLVAVVSPVGRKSLAVYVAHVWVVGLLAVFAWYHKEMGGWQILLAIPALLALWIVARMLEWKGTASHPRAKPSLARRWLPIPLGIGAALASFAVVSLTQVVPSIEPADQALILPDRLDQSSSENEPPVAPSFDPDAAADIIPA
jgi:hypothetical protein